MDNEKTEGCCSNELTFKEDYRVRLLNEYKTLITRKEKLEIFLLTEGMDIDKTKADIMWQQVSAMNTYCYALERRILLEMGTPHS